DTASSASGHEPWTIVWLFEYIGLQVLVGGPILGLGLLAWLNARKRADARSVLSVIACVAMALPLLVFYLLVALMTQTEGNWAMAAFVTLIPPAAWCVRDGVMRADHVIKFLWGAAVFVLIAALLLFPGAPELARVPGIGQLVPMYRVTGMREHAADAQRRLDQLREQTGRDPFVITNHYGRASLLAFYLPGHPTVYCSSAHIGGRKTQYDMWERTDLSEAGTLGSLLGRPALMLGGPEHHWSPAFDSIEPIGKLENEPKEQGTSYIGLGFRGFEARDPREQPVQP
ncbi:MAG: hypothetical protein ACF8LL_13670, partial [Phycisphaerales bacterium]